MSLLSASAVAAVKGASSMFRPSMPALPSHSPSPPPPPPPKLPPPPPPPLLPASSAISGDGSSAAALLLRTSTDMPRGMPLEGFVGPAATLTALPPTPRSGNYTQPNAENRRRFSPRSHRDCCGGRNLFTIAVESTGIGTSNLRVAASPEASHQWMDGTLSAVFGMTLCVAASVDPESLQADPNNGGAQFPSAAVSMPPRGGDKVPPSCLQEGNAHNSAASVLEPPPKQDPALRHKIDDASAMSPEHISSIARTPSPCQAAVTLRAHTSKLDCRGGDGTLRNLALLELLDTERSYLEDMRHIVKVFIGPVTDLPFLTDAQKEVLVRSTYRLVRFHEGFGAALRAACEPPGEMVFCKIARCFVSSEELFGLYVDHCARYDETLQLLRHLQGKPKWDSFMCSVAKGRNDAKAHDHLRVTDYLIAPVQRICRYPALIKRMLKYTSQDFEPETHAELETALQIAMKTAAAVDAQKEKLESTARTERFLSRLDEEARLQRSFARTFGDILLAGPLDVVLLNHDPAVSIPLRRMYLGCFLFNHWMIIVRARRRCLTYEPRYWFPLAQWDIVCNVGNENAFFKNSFRLVHLYQRYEIEFGASSSQEQAVWVSVLRRVLGGSKLESAAPPEVKTQHSSPRWKPLYLDTKLLSRGAASDTATPSPTTPSDEPEEALTSEAGARSPSGWDQWRLGCAFSSIARGRSAVNLAPLAGGGGGAGAGSLRPQQRQRSASYDVKAFLRRSSSSASRRASAEEKLADVCTPDIHIARAKRRLTVQTASLAPASGPRSGPCGSVEGRGGIRENILSGAISGLRRSLNSFHERNGGT